MAAALDTDKAERKVWIVRVPPYVAQQWHEAIARAANADIDEDAHTEVLGQVTIEQGLAATLQVPGEPGSSGPQVLHMNSNRDTVDTTIFSYEPAAGKASSGALQTPKVDGVVHKRYDAAPVKIVDVPQAVAGPAGLNPEQVKQEAEQRQRAAAAMQAQVDAAYLQNSRKRLAAAARAPAARKVVMIEDEKEAKMLEGGGLGKVSLYQQRQAKTAGLQEGKVKRVRMSKNDLEAQLFKKFGQVPHWHFNQLQRELEQPVAFMKEVLNEIAFQVKRGPNKDLWELKKHLQTTSQTTAQQPAQ